MADIPHWDLVSWTLDNADIEEDRLIFVDAINPHRRLLKSQVRQLVRQLIAGFRHENGGGYLDGDVVCLHAFNDILYSPITLGIIGAGGCWTGTNPAYTTSELTHHFRTSKTKLIITEPEHLPRVLAAARLCNISDTRIFALAPSEAHELHADSRDWTTLLEHGESDWIRFNDAQRSRVTAVGLFSTSGTTGLPKMAARTHLSFVAESVAIQEHQAKPYTETRLLCIPFFHAFVAPLSLVAALRQGVATYVMRRYQHDSFLTAIKQFDITETALVPPIIIKLLSCPGNEQEILRNLQLVWCAGAPLDIATQDRAVELLAPNARIAQVWGMTECGWISTFHYPESDKTGSVGRLLPSYQAKLLANDGTHLTAFDAFGEICIRGPMLMKGYHGDSSATAAAFTPDGWFRTGDVARLHGNLVYIVDRKKELIKVRGWQVSPAELEAVLIKHSGLADAAVIGVSSLDRTAEVPRAYVVRKVDCFVTEHDIKSFLLTYLARYKVGDCQIRFIESIPRNPSGKILKKALRAEVDNEALESLSRSNKESSDGLEDVPDSLPRLGVRPLVKAVGIPLMVIVWFGFGQRLLTGGLLGDSLYWLRTRLYNFHTR